MCTTWYLMRSACSVFCLVSLVPLNKLRTENLSSPCLDISSATVYWYCKNIGVVCGLWGKQRNFCARSLGFETSNKMMQTNALNLQLGRVIFVRPSDYTILWVGLSLNVRNTFRIVFETEYDRLPPNPYVLGRYRYLQMLTDELLPMQLQQGLYMTKN